MEQKIKLLLNLEESIFHLVQKRCSFIEIQSKKNTNLHNDKINEFIEKNDENYEYLTKEYILSSLNIKLPINSEIVDIYNEKYDFMLIDIDILNLIIKYISTCGKILEIEMHDLFGVKIMDYHPKQTVRFLDPQYIINKYPEGYGFAISKLSINTLKSIFTNIVIPFGIKHLLKIYCN